MSQTKREIQAILSQANAEPLHRFGQNFMIDQNLVRLVAEAGEIKPDDQIIEVGPGTGTLSEEILRTDARLIAVEIDRNLAQMLRQKFSDVEKFRLIEGDALANKHALNTELRAALSVATHPTKLVANLPYNIASPLVVELLIAGVDLMAFTVQKEVALRLKAEAGSDSYGPLSVMTQMLGRVEVLRKLPPEAFWPAPTVESSLVRIRRDDRLGSSVGSFGKMVHLLFAARRKTLRKALAQANYEADHLLAQLQIDGQLRPEMLDGPTLLRLFNAAGTAAPEKVD